MCLCVSCPLLTSIETLSFLCLHCFSSSPFWSHLQKSVLTVERESGRAPGWLSWRVPGTAARFLVPFWILQHTHWTHPLLGLAKSSPFQLLTSSWPIVLFRKLLLALWGSHSTVHYPVLSSVSSFTDSETWGLWLLVVCLNLLVFCDS